mmetsp:Transcript_19812/g.41283  ORF Transcript_19812/g.41283 Transcript_19812/m.41283 type:complete len:820 (-) Transcript_19812:1101-3560(-)
MFPWCPTRNGLRLEEPLLVSAVRTVNCGLRPPFPRPDKSAIVPKEDLPLPFRLLVVEEANPNPRHPLVRPVGKRAVVPVQHPLPYNPHPLVPILGEEERRHPQRNPTAVHHHRRLDHRHRPLVLRRVAHRLPLDHPRHPHLLLLARRHLRLALPRQRLLPPLALRQHPLHLGHQRHRLPLDHPPLRLQPLRRLVHPQRHPRPLAPQHPAHRRPLAPQRGVQRPPRLGHQPLLLLRHLDHQRGVQRRLRLGRRLRGALLHPLDRHLLGPPPVIRRHHHLLAHHPREVTLTLTPPRLDHQRVPPLPLDHLREALHHLLDRLRRPRHHLLDQHLVRRLLLPLDRPREALRHPLDQQLVRHLRLDHLRQRRHHPLDHLQDQAIRQLLLLLGHHHHPLDLRRQRARHHPLDQQQDHRRLHLVRLDHRRLPLVRQRAPLLRSALRVATRRALHRLALPHLACRPRLGLRRARRLPLVPRLLADHHRPLDLQAAIQQVLLPLGHQQVHHHPLDRRRAPHPHSDLRVVNRLRLGHHRALRHLWGQRVPHHLSGHLSHQAHHRLLDHHQALPHLLDHHRALPHLLGHLHHQARHRHLGHLVVLRHLPLDLHRAAHHHRHLDLHPVAHHHRHLVLHRVAHHLLLVHPLVAPHHHLGHLRRQARRRRLALHQAVLRHRPLARPRLARLLVPRQLRLRHLLDRRQARHLHLGPVLPAVLRPLVPINPKREIPEAVAQRLLRLDRHLLVLLLPLARIQNRTDRHLATNPKRILHSEELQAVATNHPLPCLVLAITKRKRQGIIPLEALHQRAMRRRLVSPWEAVTKSLKQDL